MEVTVLRGSAGWHEATSHPGADADRTGTVAPVPSLPPATAAALGRGVVVSGAEVPGPWRDAERITVVGATLADPGDAIGALHAAWASRRPVVVQLGVGADVLRARERSTVPPHRLTPAFEFPLERLHFLVWANNYDARGGEPVWWHARKAARTWEGAAEGGPADVRLADGTPVLVDGGPLPGLGPDGDVVVVHRFDAEAGRLPRRSTGLVDDRGRLADPSGGALAPDQQAAVTHRAGAARVIAPAGSGKTRVLTERLRHLLGPRGVHPSLVTVVAYNAKAADELRARCGDLVGSSGPHIRTLNSLGLQICDAARRRAGGGRYRTLGEPEVRDLVEGLFSIRRRANTDVVAPYVEALSAVRLGLVDPAAAEAANPDAQGVAEGFERYRAALAAQGALDFDEQIYHAIAVLLDDPSARAAAQATCRMLLVDEFQDLTPAHLLLLRLLAAPGFDCFGVGDDDQVLYGYSGASPEFLVHFDRYFPGAAAHALEVNYRCPAPVVDAAAALLSHNTQRVDKVIRPPDAEMAYPASGAVVVCCAPGAELGRIAAATVAGWLEAGAATTDVAVLARVNSALLPVHVALTESGVPCDSLLDARVLNRTGVRTAFAYLRIGADPGHIRRADLLETVRRPSRGLAPMVVDMLAKGPATSLSDIRRLAGRLSGRDVPKLLAFAEAVEVVAAACAGATADALRTVRDGIGLGETMEVLDASRPALDRSTHADDLTALGVGRRLPPRGGDLRAVAAGPARAAPARRAGGAALDGAPHQGAGVGQGPGLRGHRRVAAAPPGR